MNFYDQISKYSDRELDYYKIISEGINLVNNNNILTKEGVEYMQNYFNQIINTGLIIRSHLLYTKQNSNNKIYIYQDSVYSDKEKTLSCRTPTGGYHYVFKLTEQQQEILGDEKFGSELQLFDVDIDVLYNTGRFIMCGAYWNNNMRNQGVYLIKDFCDPVIIPDILFDEIVIRKDKLSKPRPQKCPITKINNSSKTVHCKQNNNDVIKQQKICMLTEYLPEEYLNNYTKWFQIMTIYYNEGMSFELFDEWSKASNKYDMKQNKKEWNKLRKERKKKATLMTLKNIIKNINPEGYREVIDKFNDELLEEVYISKEITDDFFAKLFYNWYPNKFVCEVSEKHERWYSLNEYNIYCKEGINLQPARQILCKDFINKINIDLNKRIENLKQYYEQTKEKTKKKSEILNEKIAKLNKLCGKMRKVIGTEHRKSNIINSIKKFYMQKDIAKRFDTINPYVFAFTNGVWDLKKKCLRKAKPEELILTTTGYPYQKPKQEYVDHVYSILKSIIENEEELEFLLKSLSTCLIGENLLELYYVWIGLDGRNGKGLIKELMKTTFGDDHYFGTIDVNYFIESKYGNDTDKATPQLAQVKSARVVFVNEMKGIINLRSEFLKKITGRDEIKARCMRENGCHYVAQYKLIFSSNDKPKFDASEGALVERLRIVMFRNRFVINPKSKNERKIIPNLKTEISKDPEYRYAFLQILLNYYDKFERENKLCEIPIPKKLDKELNVYIKENDTVKQFIDTYIDITSDKKDRIGAANLFGKFTNEYGETMTAGRFKQVLKTTHGIKQKRYNNGYNYMCVKYKDTRKMEI